MYNETPDFTRVLADRRTGAEEKELGRKGPMVPRGGIEPPTLRFSVACSTN